MVNNLWEGNANQPALLTIHCLYALDYLTVPKVYTAVMCQIFENYKKKKNHVLKEQQLHCHQFAVFPLLAPGSHDLFFVSVVGFLPGMPYTLTTEYTATHT